MQKWSTLLLLLLLLLDIFLQFEMPRFSPASDAIHHVISKTDKTSKLEVKYINAEKGKTWDVAFNILISPTNWEFEISCFCCFKGRGVFTTKPFCRVEFVVEYRGDMINQMLKPKEDKKFSTHHSLPFFFFQVEREISVVSRSLTILCKLYKAILNSLNSKNNSKRMNNSSDCAMLIYVSCFFFFLKRNYMHEYQMGFLSFPSFCPQHWCLKRR